MIKYKIDKTEEIIFVTISGSVTRIDLMIHMSNILNDPDFSSRYHSIITIDDTVIVPNISIDKVPIIQDVINGYAQRRKGNRWAIVIPNRTKRAIVETALDLVGPISANIRIFCDTVDAFAWIND